MIELVIFDFDDTLIDNIKMDYQSFVIPCRELGIHMIPFTEIVKFRKNGLKAKEIIDILLKEENQKDLLQKFVEIREKFLAEPRSFRFLKLKNNVQNFLELLKQNSIRCILCSSRENKNKIIDFLKEENVFDYFSTVLNRDDISVNIDNRNDLDRLFIKNVLMRRILKFENINPAHILYIGNAMEDFVIAENMKMNFICFQNYYLKENEFSDVLKVNTMEGLIEEFKKLNVQGEIKN